MEKLSELVRHLMAVPSAVSDTIMFLNSSLQLLPGCLLNLCVGYESLSARTVALCWMHTIVRGGHKVYKQAAHLRDHKPTIQSRISALRSFTHTKSCTCRDSLFYTPPASPPPPLSRPGTEENGHVILFPTCIPRRMCILCFSRPPLCRCKIR